VNDPDGRRTATVTVLFCDLVGSTERQSRHGDDMHDEFRRRFFAALTACARSNHGEVVKNTGDGLMVVFRHSAVDAVACAVAMHAETEALDADNPAGLYVGISAGEAADEDGDWFGTPVNEAARLCAAAKPGQTLTNEVVRALVGSRGTFAFRSVGALALKGLPAPVAGVEVLRTGAVDVADEAAARAGSRPRRPLGRKPLAAAIGALVVVLIAGAVALVDRGGPASKASPSPTPATLPHDYKVSFAAKKCPADEASQIAGLTCGTLTVPQDRSKPQGRTVTLDVYRAPARGAAAADVVVDFGADDLASSPARDHREEIQLGQRGYGGEPGSSPVLTCPEYAKIAGDALTKPSGDATEQKRDAAALLACHDRLTKAGIDLGTYNYLTSGDDMVDLIDALHLRHVDIVTGYVETIAALEVVRRLPGTVRTLTVQDPLAGGSSRFTDPTGFLSNAFNSYVALCRADTTCKSAFPDLPGALKRDYELYRAHPRVATSDDGNGHHHAVLIDGPRIAQAIYAGLNDRSDYSVLAAGIAAVDRTPAVDALTAGRILLYNEPLLDPEYPWGTALSGYCSYEQFTVGGGHVLSSSAVPQLSGVDDGFLEWACPAWKVPKIGDVAFDDPKTDVPALLVGGDLSPNADQQWADDVQRTLPNATVAQFPTLNGFVLGNNDPRCLADLRRRFLDDPAAPLDTAGCERQSPVIRFVGSP